MIQCNWTWTLFVGVSFVIALLLYYKIDLGGPFLAFVFQVYVYGLCLWVICLIISKISGAFKAAVSNSERVAAHDAKYTHRNDDESVSDEERHEKQRLQQERNRQSRQTNFDNQAQDYRKRILEPREEERKKRKERMLKHVLGDEGQPLGYDGSRPRPTSSERSSSESDHNAARENRRLPDHVILHRPRQEVAEDTVKVKKRVIKLPDEPDVADDNVVTIILHTPLNQKYSRKFLCSCKLQIVFDYMTTLGFSQSMYTLTVAFPRQQLKHMVDRSLLDMKFGRRIVLHIDEDC